MPITSTRLVRSTAALLLLGLLALVGIVGTSLWLGERTQSYFDEVLEARAARSTGVDLRNSLLRAETGQRGFLLTLDERYLSPYETARNQIMPEFEKLRTLLLPYPKAHDPMLRLKDAITGKLDELAETIDLARQGRVDEARGIVLSDKGRALMDEANTFFTALIAAADERLTTGVTDQRNSANALRWVSLVGGLVIIAVVGGAIWTVFLHTKELGAARAELETLNQGLEERVQERTADLGRANEEIQRFAYIVTHDLRAPLVNIMGFTSELETSFEVLKSYFSSQPGQTDAAIADAGTLEVEARQAALEDMPEAINFIRSSTRKMDGLINAILKLSREGRRTLKAETVDLSALVQACSAAIQHQVTEGGGEIKLDIATPPIVSDRLALEHVFGNLLDNAAKYRDPSRPLLVKVSARPSASGRVDIEVADNGRGIAKQDHERVFELFRRSGSQDKPGEGIGLPHVRAIVRNLGGDITMSSELGQGTSFRISLPRDVRSASRSKAA